MRQGFIVLQFLPGEYDKGEVLYVLKRKIKPEKYLLDEADACRQAEDLAKSNPKVPVVVLKTVHVFETKIPDIIHKQYNEKGELTLK